MIPRIKGAVTEFLHTVMYCLKLSYRASGFYTIFRLLARFAQTALAIGMTWLTGRTADALTGAAEGGMKTVLWLFGMVLLVKLGTKVFSDMNQYCMSMHNDILQNYLNRYTMGEAVKADMEYYDSPAFYNTIESVKRDSYAVTAIVWNMIDGAGALVTFITAFVMISRNYFLFALLLTFTALPSAIVSRKYTKSVYSWDLQHIDEQRRMGYLHTVASGRQYVPEVRLYGIGDYLIQKYTGIWKRFYTNRKKLIRKRTVFTIFMNVLPEICTVGMMLYMGVNVLEGRDTIGGYTLYTGLLAQLSGSILMLNHSFTSIYEDRLRIENVKRMEHFEVKVKNTGKRKLSGAVSIEFRDVSFSYPGTDKVVLDHVSFRVEKSAKVCIVGLNGAGKSTVMKLLLRFYDVTSGEILIDDIDIREYELGALRRNFNMFFQQVNQYSFTLRENISLSDRDKEPEDAAVYEALRLCDGAGMAQSLPGGLDQYITKSFEPDGVELSGGQYQKIALARMFYRDSGVVLLDEPSASLDPEAEHRLFCCLEEYCQGKTAVFTSHRLSNIHLADYIVLIENGKVIEKGTHEDLMERQGRYAQLYAYQAEKYRDYGVS